MTLESRRTYYDHEPAYRRIMKRDGRGWDDLHERKRSSDSYLSLERFLDSRWFSSMPGPVRALDLGCGGGQATIRLAQRGCQVCGIDFSETAIELARRNISSAGVRAHVIVGDVLRLESFADDEFDLIVDNHLLHCIIAPTDRFELIGSLRRVLRPGGRLFSETMTAEGVLDMDAFEIDPATRVNRNHTRFWTTRAEFNALLHSVDFAILDQFSRVQNEVPAPGELMVSIAERGLRQD